MKCRDDPHPVDVVEFSAQVSMMGSRAGAWSERQTFQGSRRFSDGSPRSGASEKGCRRELRPARDCDFRRAAFQDVADVDVLALNACGFDDLRQKPACFTNEGQTLLVFFVTRRFSDKDNLRVGIARTKDNRGARRRELAALAIADVGADGFEGVDGSQTGGGGDGTAAAGRVIDARLMFAIRYL